MDLVATEASYWQADVIGLNEKMAIEVEVKVSRADMLAEFRNKRPKHGYYKSAKHWTPNFFYFLVPAHLQEDAIEIVTANNPSYGVLVYPEDSTRRNGKKLVVAKKAKRLHADSPSGDLLRSVSLRMGSELCGLHIAHDRINTTLWEHIRAIADDVSKQVKEAVEQEQDHEETDSPEPL